MGNNKLYNFIDSLYTYFKVSFYFWLFLLKGFIFYGLIPSAGALLLTIHFIKEKDEDGDIKEKFRGYYKKFESYKLHSFIFSFLFLFLYVLLIYLSKHLQNPVSLILIIVVGYSLVLSSVMFAYVIYFLCYRDLSFKQALAIGFVTGVRKWTTTLAVLAITIVMLYIAYLNLAFFVIFGPFLFGLGIRLAFRNLENVKI